LKEHVANVKVVGVQPTPDAVSGPPENVNTVDGVVRFECSHPFLDERNFACDEIIDVTGDESYTAARDAAQTDGIFLGASAGAALAAAHKLALRPENEGKNIVIIMADNGMKYLSTNMYK
jgi:cysteine synthase A